jgi:RIO-like serine/threonine protein kinase
MTGRALHFQTTDPNPENTLRRVLEALEASPRQMTRLQVQEVVFNRSYGASFVNDALRILERRKLVSSHRTGRTTGWWITDAGCSSLLLEKAREGSTHVVTLHPSMQAPEGEPA